MGQLRWDIDLIPRLSPLPGSVVHVIQGTVSGSDQAIINPALAEELVRQGHISVCTTCAGVQGQIIYHPASHRRFAERRAPFTNIPRSPAGSGS